MVTMLLDLEIVTAPSPSPIQAFASSPLYTDPPVPTDRRLDEEPINGR
jgi:hypothetical protein